MNKKVKKLVVVLGMHRSGTSAIAGLLYHLGANLGHSLIQSGPDNATGFFEDTELVALNDEILSKIGLTWSSCQKIDWLDTTLEELNLTFGARASALIERITSSDLDVDVIKDPRVSRLLPFWSGVFLNKGVNLYGLWVLRNPVSVYHSLAYRNGYTPEKSFSLWARYNLDILNFIPKDRLLLVDFDQTLGDEISIATRVANTYGLRQPRETYVSFLDRRLAHSKNTLDKPLTSFLTTSSKIYTYANDLYALLKSNQNRPIDIDNIESYLEASATQLDYISDSTDAAIAREKSWLSEQIEWFSKENLSLSKQVDRLNQEKSWLSEQIEWFSKENLSLSKQVDRLNQENYRLNAQIADIFASRSWKILGVYRFFGQKVPRLIRSPIFIYIYIHSLLTRLLRLLHRASGFSTSRSNEAEIHELAQGRMHVLENALKKSGTNFDQLPNIDIILVTYNSSRWIDGFFSSLHKQKYPLSRINLLITDNDSQDDTLDKIRHHTRSTNSPFHSINIAKLSNNGFGSGAHCAIEKGTADFILVTNVDLEFTEDSLLSAVAYATGDPENIASWELRQQPYEHPKYYDPITLKTSWSSHACVLMRRKAYMSVGGYEKRIFMYGEDVELSYRFRREGYLLKYLPSAVVYHYSYENENSFKPVQFYGSTLANAYIRLRYGNIRDVLGLVFLYLALYLNGGPPGITRSSILSNIGKIIINSPYFLLSRKRRPKSVYFPFRKWDYEMVREGAFYSSPSVDASTPKISVITRTYQGREKWLKEAISSVINQTYRKIELIIVEDGGETQKGLIERYSTLFTGERSIHYSAQAKKGRSHNGNAGLEAASGDYIMFLDDDDLLFPDHIEILAKELIANEKIVASYALSWDVSTNYVRNKESFYIEKMHSTPDLLRQEFDREVLKHHNYFPIQSVLFRRTLFDYYGGFDVDMEQLEDWDLWFRYSSESDFKYIPKITSLYRTPYKASEKADRHQLLHENYEYAKGKQAAFLQSLPIMKATVSFPKPANVS